MSAQEVSELTVTFGGLNIRISREAPEAGQTGDTESIGSFFVVEAPGTGALAAPSGPSVLLLENLLRWVPPAEPWLRCR